MLLRLAMQLDWVEVPAICDIKRAQTWAAPSVWWSGGASRCRKPMAKARKTTSACWRSATIWTR